MKKINFHKKLSLDSESIAKLTEDQRKQIRGGRIEMNAVASCVAGTCDTNTGPDSCVLQSCGCTTPEP